MNNHKQLLEVKKLQQSQLLIILLASILIMGLIIQFDAVYTEYLIRKLENDGSGIFFCFRSSYQNLWIVSLLEPIGIMISLKILMNNKWELPVRQYEKIIILSPLILYITDSILLGAVF